MRQKILATLLVLSMLFPAALAAEETAPYSGYLFRLREEGVMLYSSLPESIDPVLPEMGLYKADSVEEIQRFVPDEAVAYIEPDYLVTLFDAPNDTLYGEQWGLSMLGAEAAWGAGLDGSGVRIGIIDSGLYAEHEDLAGAKIVPGYNYLDDSGDTSDDVGHGTFVAGLIAASRGNGLGISGLAPGAEIVPLKCFDSKSQTTNISLIVKALHDAVYRYQCDIINMSFGWELNSSTAMKEEVSAAAEQGAILIAAVGNDGAQSSWKLNYPAAYDSVIGVGMVGADGVVAAASQKNKSVFVTAPGDQVLGLGIDGIDSYRTWGGTSFSCPYVSAAAALLKQARPELTANALMELLQTASVDLGKPGYDTSYGYGLVSLPKLLRALPLRMTPRGDAFQLWCVFDGGAEAPRLFAACWDGEGRMLACTELPFNKAGGTVAVSCEKILPLGTEQISVYALDGDTLRPLQRAKRWGSGE